MPLQSADMTQKSGDDYAARVYLSFEVAPERLGLGTRMDLGLARSLLGEKVPDAAVNYIWDYRHAVGTDNTSEEARAGVRPDGSTRQPCISARNKDLNREQQTYPEFLAGHAGPEAAQPVAGGADSRRLTPLDIDPEHLFPSAAGPAGVAPEPLYELQAEPQAAPARH